jgi:hypothetical protein
VISANLFQMAFNFGSGFGVPQQPAFSQFQQAAAHASTFGVQSFGAQPNAPAFGAQGMGGAQGFATPAPNPFAAACAPNSPHQGGFGAAAPAIGFATQGSGFGVAPAPNAFGAPSFNTAPASGGFGASAAPASFNAGGTVGFQSQTYGAQPGFSKQAGDKGDGNAAQFAAAFSSASCLAPSTSTASSSAPLFATTSSTITQCFPPPFGESPVPALPGASHSNAGRPLQSFREAIQTIDSMIARMNVRTLPILSQIALFSNDVKSRSHLFSQLEPSRTSLPPNARQSLLRSRSFLQLGVLHLHPSLCRFLSHSHRCRNVQGIT